MAAARVYRPAGVFHRSSKTAPGGAGVLSLSGIVADRAWSPPVIISGGGGTHITFPQRASFSSKLMSICECSCKSPLVMAMATMACWRLWTADAVTSWLPQRDDEGRAAEALRYVICARDAACMLALSACGCHRRGCEFSRPSPPSCMPAKKS